MRLKDDKHYPYLRVDVQSEWPRVEIARRVQNDGARYFGPYASASSVRTTLSVVKKLFPWRSCTKTITGTDPRPCLDYFIHRCIAPCTAFCTKEEYDEVIRQTLLFLEGRTSEVIKSLRSQMEVTSAELQFERSALFRDQIKAVESVAEKQFVERIRPTDEDVFGLARDPSTLRQGSGQAETRVGPSTGSGRGTEACVQVFFIRGTQMVGRDFFTLDGVKDETDGEVLGSFLKQYYESAVYVPKTVVVPFAVPEASLIAEWLGERRGGKVTIAVAQRGVRRRMVDLAAENARRVARDAARALAGGYEQAGPGAGRAAGGAGPAGLSASHRVLRHLEHPGDELGGEHGGVHRWSAAAAGVPTLPDQGGGGGERLRVDGGGAGPAFQALGH